jgi:uncharacterized membrane protein YfcA
MSFLLGYSNGALAFLAGSALIAGLARGFSGFGGALIFVPLASSVVGPRLAAPLLLIVDAVAASSLIPNAWRNAARREVGTMAAGALVGVPLGALLLAMADPLALRWGLASMVAVSLVVLVSGWRYRGRRTKPVTVGVGLVAGLLSGSIQVGGPPVIAYWLSSPLGPHIVRANFVLYFAISGLLSGVAYVAGGVLTHAALVLALLVAPAYGLGIYLGSRMFGLASETTFRRICFALIAVATVVSMPVLDQMLRH